MKLVNLFKPMTPKTLKVKDKELVWGSKTYIMGILNLTPDSFSADGIYNSSPKAIDAAILKAEQMLNDGADIIDVGGESTRPGAQLISVEQEISRVTEVIEAISKRFDILISIDTYKSKVAAVALQAGAAIINDVWALQADPKMAKVAAEYKVPIILMHNCSKLSQVQICPKLGGSYSAEIVNDIVSDIMRDLQLRIDQARSEGIEQENIIIDPGFGFGKNVAQNLETLARFSELVALGYPLLSGPSRKSFIGQTLNLPVTERLEGTLAAITLSIERGADIVRVHDVKEASRVASFVDSVMRLKL